MNDFEYLVFGAGGFGREVAWLITESFGANAKIAYVIDPELIVSSNGRVGGCPVIAADSIDFVSAPPLVVAVGEPAARRKIVARLLARGARFRNLVDRGFRCSSSVRLGEGSIICAGCVATVDIAIGAHVHVNLNCTIGHNVVIDDFSTLSPGVHVSGNVEIDAGVFIGTGACIINGKPSAPLRIGAGATVAAGAVVIGDVPPGALVAGVPAVRKR